jgi:hypothetical protein
MRFMRKDGLAFVSVLVGGLAVLGTIRHACAQCGQMSYKTYRSDF